MFNSYKTHIYILLNTIKYKCLLRLSHIKLIIYNIYINIGIVDSLSKRGLVFLAWEERLYKCTGRISIYNQIDDL